MTYSRRSRYSRSPSPYKRFSRLSVSRSLSRSRSRSRDSSDVDNPGNNLYVTGLSTRVTKRDLEKHFSTEGKVKDVHLVVDPLTRVSRGFGFVTMSSLEEAERCIKYLDRSVLESRVITVEKGSCDSSSPKLTNQIKAYIRLLFQRARRRRGRTPTPGRYLGLRAVHARPRRRSPSYSPPYSRSRSPRYSSDRDRSRSHSYSPYDRQRCRSYSPRSYSRSRSPSYRRFPYYSWPDRSYSPHYYRDYYSRDNRYYSIRSRYRSITPPRHGRHFRRSYYSSSRSRSVSPRYDYSPSVSPSPRKMHFRRSYYSSSRSRSVSPRCDYSRSVSPSPRKKHFRRSSSSSPSGPWRYHYTRSVSPPSPISRSSRRHSKSPSVSSFSSRSVRRSYSP